MYILLRVFDRIDRSIDAMALPLNLKIRHGTCPFSSRILSTRVQVKAKVSPKTFMTKSYVLKIGECSIPHPDKADYGGEDAYFVSSLCFGVSDGVGGWQESGINPAEYSQGLMDEAKLYFEEEILQDDVIDDSGVSTEVQQPRSTLGALTQAHQRTRKPGSATACILKVDSESGELEASNLGDSGFLVIRDGNILMQSPVQEHFFDCPFQLGAAPEYVPETDYPEDSNQIKQQLQGGDVIVLATDGLWDNVSPQDIIQIVESHGTTDDLNSLAQALGSMAFDNSQNAEFESPYALEARKAGLELSIWDKLSAAKFTEQGFKLGEITGGKMDDITVLVASVVNV